MKKRTSSRQNLKPAAKAKRAQQSVTIGIDLGDRNSRYCVLSEEGEILREGQVATTKAGMTETFGSHPYTSLNGNMFSYLHPSGSMALRLPADERDKFLKRFKTTLFEAYGVIQKEYVTVPEALLKNTKELEKYFHLSWQYTDPETESVEKTGVTTEICPTNFH